MMIFKIIITLIIVCINEKKKKVLYTKEKERDKISTTEDKIEKRTF